MQTLNELMELDDQIEDGGNEKSISEVFHIIWLRRRLLVSVILFIMLPSSIIIFQLVPRYTASTSLLVGIDSSQVVDIKEVFGESNASSAMLNEVEVLKSRELARRVIEKLHLDKSKTFNPLKKKPGFLSQFKFKNLFPEDWQQALGLVKINNRSEEDKKQARQTSLINAFLGKLQVFQVGSSGIIVLYYTSNNPKLAARIVNEIADQYIIDKLRAKFYATKKATNWLNNQLSELKDTVKYSEQAVEVFRKEHNLMEVANNMVMSQQQLSQIHTQLIITRAERTGVQAKYDQVSNILKSGRDIDNVSVVLSSGLIGSLRQQETSIQQTYSELLVEYGKKHLKMIQVRARLKEIREKIKLEIKKIAEGLLNDLRFVQSRERSLTESLKQVANQTSGDKQANVQLRALEREAQANRVLFETFLIRFKETSAIHGIEEAHARVISFAEPPLGPSYPKRGFYLFISGACALFFAIVLIFLLEMLNPGIRSPEQVQELLKMTTLGIIPDVDILEGMTVHQYVLDKPQSSLAESVNTLRVSLSVLNPDSQVKTLLVTSSIPSEGKSTLVLLIARQSAQAGQSVVVIDTDFRRPTLEKELNLNDQLGLTDLLTQHEMQLDDVLVEDPDTGMMILTRGRVKQVNPTDHFASQRMKAIVDELKARFDLVIFDSPPVMAVSDAHILSALVDRVIFVLKWDETPRKVALSALKQLQQRGQSPVAGIVLQKVDLKQYGRYGDSGYYYHYSYNHYYTG